MENNVMQSSYLILPENGVVIETITGKVKLKKMKTDRDLIYSEPNFKAHFDFLLDTRDAQILLNEEELIEYLEYLSNKTNILCTRKTVMLTRPELKEEFEHSFKQFKGMVPMDFHIFCDIETCCTQWLNKINISRFRLSGILKSLKETPHFQWFKEPNCVTGF